MHRRFDAVIVGAGPAGCAAAIVLARAGWAVALVEKAVFPRAKVCGECIAASNLPLLDALGVGRAVASAAGPELRHVALMRGAECVVADLPPAQQDARWGRALGRPVLDAMLRDEACRAGATVLQPWSVDACERHDDVWRCRVHACAGADEATLHAAVLIDAHGSWQALRIGASTAITPARRASDLFAFKAVFDAASLRPGLLPVLSFPGGYGGMVIADGGLATVACCVRRDRLAAWRAAQPGAAAGAVVETMLRANCVGVDVALAGAQRRAPWLAVGPLSIGVRVDIDDEVLRIGNAAGEAHPILGEGISMALQSATLLAGQLVAQPPGGRSLAAWRREHARAYARTWRQGFAGRCRLAAVFAHAAMGARTGAALQALLRASPALLTAGARWGGKLDSAVDPAAAWLAS